MRKIIIFVLSLATLFCVISFSACGSGGSVSKATLTFKGGNGALGNEIVKEINEGNNYILPNNPFTKQGYKFVSWYDGEKEYNEGELYKAQTTKTFTAKWVKVLTDLSITEYPIASVITYGDKLSKSTLSGGVANIDGKFEWVNGEVVPNVKNDGYYVKFVPTDVDCESVILEQKIVIEVNKKIVTEIDFPKASPIIYGDTVGKSVLTNGSSFGEFEWVNSNEQPSTCGTFSYPVTMTLNDENYDISEANLTSDVSVVVEKKNLYVKAISEIFYGDDVPTIDNYNIEYSGFAFSDDSSVLSGELSLGETTYQKGDKGTIFYGELNVNNVTSDNYNLKSMGADILLKVKLTFNYGIENLYDSCYYGDRYTFKSKLDGMPKFIYAEKYSYNGKEHNVNDTIIVDTWNPTPISMITKGAVSLGKTDVSFTAGSRLYSGFEKNSEVYANAIGVNLQNVGTYPNPVLCSFYRFSLKGVDYRNYESLSIGIASNVNGLKIFTTDGIEIFSTISKTAHTIVVTRDGAFKIDGELKGTFENGEIAFDIDRSVSVYSQLWISPNVTVVDGQNITLNDSNVFVVGLSAVGKLHDCKAIYNYTDKMGEEDNVNYIVDSIKELTIDGKVVYSTYYELIIDKSIVDYKDYDSLTFYVAMNQDKMHKLFCGTTELATILSHKQIKITIKRDGSIYINDNLTNGKLNGENISFKIFVENGKEGTVSKYTSFYISDTILIN